MPAEHLADPVASVAAAVVGLLSEPPLLVGGREYSVFQHPAPSRMPDGTPVAPPYVTVQLYPAPDVVFANRRAMGEVEATVSAVGPAEKGPLLSALAVEADLRLEAFAPAIGPDGAVVQDCQRRSPVRYPEPGDGRVLLHVGGVYVVHVS